MSASFWDFETSSGATIIDKNGNWVRSKSVIFWMPIESAPKEKMLITWHDFGMVVDNPAHPLNGSRGYAIIQSPFGEIWPSEMSETGRVTHWMPLPEPPNAP